MAVSTTQLVVLILLLVALALASPSDSHDPTYTLPSIPTITAAILGPPFVNPPSMTTHDVQAPYTTESTSRLTPSINTATLETRTSTHVLGPIMARIGLQVTSSISTANTGSEAPMATCASDKTPTSCREANESGEADGTVACMNELQGRALRPIPVSDSGSVPLRGWSGWTWCAGLGIFSMGMLVML